MTYCTIARILLAVLLLANYSETTGNDFHPEKKSSLRPREPNMKGSGETEFQSMGFIATPFNTYEPSRQVKANFVKYPPRSPIARNSVNLFDASLPSGNAPSLPNAVTAELLLDTNKLTVHLANYADKLVQVKCGATSTGNLTQIMTIETISTDVKNEVVLHWVQGTVVFMQSVQVAGTESCGRHLFRQITGHVPSSKFDASSTSFQISTTIVENPERLIDKYSVVVQYLSFPEALPLKNHGKLSDYYQAQNSGNNIIQDQIENDHNHSKKQMHVAVNYNLTSKKVNQYRIPLISESNEVASTCVNCYMVGDMGLVFKVEGDFANHNITLGVDGNYKINMDIELSGPSAFSETLNLSSVLSRMPINSIVIPGIVELNPQIVLKSMVSVSANTTIHSKDNITLGFDGQIPFSSTLSGKIFRFPKHNGWIHPKINFHVPRGIPYGVSIHLIPHLTLVGSAFFLKKFNIDTKFDHQIGVMSKEAQHGDPWCKPGETHHFAFENNHLGVSLSACEQPPLDVTIWESGLNYLEGPHYHICEPRH